MNFVLTEYQEFLYSGSTPVDFTQLKLFKDIATAGSVSRGAALNNLSQSAASQYLQDLEESLGGVTLLDRSTRPLGLTSAGKCYLELCRDVLRRHVQFQSELDQLKATVEGVVRVASIYSVGLSELSHLEQEFYRQYPNTTVEVNYLRPEKVYESVLADTVDFGLVSYPEASRQINVIPWREEQMVVALSPYHPLASRQEIVPFDLDGADFVAFDEDLPIRHNIDRFFREHRVTVNVTLHFDNLQMIKEAVAHGSGISILPARAMEAEIAQGRLIPVSIAAPELFRPVGIIHRRKKHFHRVAKAFLDLLQEQPAEVSRMASV